MIFSSKRSRSARVASRRRLKRSAHGLSRHNHVTALRFRFDYAWLPKLGESGHWSKVLRLP
jgi:hypothetical protein